MLFNCRLVSSRLLRAIIATHALGRHPIIDSPEVISLSVTIFERLGRSNAPLNEREANRPLFDTGKEFGASLFIGGIADTFDNIRVVFTDKSDVFVTTVPFCGYTPTARRMGRPVSLLQEIEPRPVTHYL